MDANESQEQVLRERVVAFAAQQGVTFVAGSSHCAAVAQEVELHMPAAEDPAREALEDAVRKVGLWSKLAVFNAQKFKTAWQEEGVVSPGGKEALQGYVKEAVTPHARLRKLKGGEE